MIRNLLATCVFLATVFPLSAADDTGSSEPARLTSNQIADKNVTARGGLNAWRAVRTMTLTGKVGAGGNRRAAMRTPADSAAVAKSGVRNVNLPSRPVEEVQLPFVMHLMRPRKMRFELVFNGQTAVQIYDGSNGWKLRPFLGRNVVEPYTAEEARIASLQAELDGPLIDYLAKGTKIELEGTEKVEDRDCYRLKLTTKSGQQLHAWIDAKTFLEAKMEGQPRRLDGIEHPVEVYFRDYRSISGLQIPFLLETRVLPADRTPIGQMDPAVPPEKSIVENVVVNPALEASLFVKPEIPAQPGQAPRTDTTPGTPSAPVSVAAPVPSPAANPANPDPKAQPATQPTVAANRVQKPETRSTAPEAKQPVTGEEGSGLNQRARILLGQGKVQEAIAELDRAVAKEPGNALHYNTRGYAYVLLRDPKKALADLDQAIKLNPNYLNAYKNRSAARKLAGDTPGSAEDLVKFQELSKTASQH